MEKEKAFKDQEVRNFLFKTHLKNHIFEYVLKILAKMGFAALIVWIANGTDYILPIFIGFLLGAVEVLMELRTYKDDWIELEIAKRNKQ